MPINTDDVELQEYADEGEDHSQETIRHIHQTIVVNSTQNGTVRI